ncbi:MAG: hypothetical protein AB7E21_05605, partial [Pseudodonghicola sp.]
RTNVGWGSQRMSKVHRFIEYRRAEWFADGGVLEQAVRDAHAELPQSRDRVVERFDGSSDMGALFLPYVGEGVALHCTRYVDGQPAGVVSMVPDQRVSVSERAPGNQENFLHLDFVAFIQGNHVLTMNAAQGGAALRNYLQGLFRLAGLPESRTKFGLMRCPAVDQLARIEAAGGVEQILLDMTIEEATALALEDQNRPAPAWGAERMLRPLTRLMNDLIMSDTRASDVGRSQKGRLRLSIGVPKGDIVAAKEGLNGVGEILIEDEDADNYVIKLRNGDQIKPDEMAVKKKIRVDRFANTVDTSQVITEMREFMAELRDSGQLR